MPTTPTGGGSRATVVPLSRCPEHCQQRIEAADDRVGDVWLVAGQITFHAGELMMLLQQLLLQLLRARARARVRVEARVEVKR